MKRSDQDRLLREILEEGETADFRAASLARGMDFLRRRRRRNRLAQACCVCVPAVLLFIALALYLALLPAGTRIAVVTAPAAQTDPSKVKIINDEELFALFPKPGHGLDRFAGASATSIFGSRRPRGEMITIFSPGRARLRRAVTRFPRKKSRLDGVSPYRKGGCPVICHRHHGRNNDDRLG